MLTQKQWKIQYITGHMANVAVTAAAEAARRSAEHQPMVREHAVIAEEIRSLTRKMTEAVEQNIFGKLDDSSFELMMKDAITMSKMLALNAALTAGKMRENKALAVFAEEIGVFSLELSELYGHKQKYADIPTVASENRVAAEGLNLFRAVSGQFTWYENTRFVNEVLIFDPEFVKNERLVVKNEWREMDMPFVKFGDVPVNAGVVIVSDDRDSKKHYAVLAEIRIHSLMYSRMGISQLSTSEFPARDCWLASDGSEMIFPDWEKMVL